MKSEDSKHLRCGELMALCMSEEVLEKNQTQRQHLETCPWCADLYYNLLTVLKSNQLNKPEQYNIDGCPTTDIDYIALFLTLLSEDLPEEAATSLFRHFNNCSRCFEDLVSNWNAFLSIKTTN